MKKILLIGCLLCANLQAQFYNFESAATGSSGISTATARQNTGWTSNGTTAQDTLATYYLINGKFQRQMWVDTDNDSVIIAPHALFPLAGKDATSLLFAFDSTGRLGLNALTSAQARRAIFNVLGRAANDTLAIFSNDGGGIAGDSTWALLSNMHWNFGTGANTAMIDFPASPTNEILWAVRAAGAPRVLLGRDASSLYATYGFDGTNAAIINANSSGDFNVNSFGGVRITSAASQAIIAATSTKGKQAFLTVNANGAADTTFMVRNDKNSTLDSTMMVFANGDGYFGGNNLYLGGHRIRSNAAGDSLIFYDGSTMIFAILSDGSTADLVAGTPPTSRRYIPPPDYIWLLRIGVFLLLLLSILMIYDFVTKLRAKRAQRERLKLLASYAIQRTDI